MDEWGLGDPDPPTNQAGGDFAPAEPIDHYEAEYPPLPPASEEPVLQHAVLGTMQQLGQTLDSHNGQTTATVNQLRRRVSELEKQVANPQAFATSFYKEQLEELANLHKHQVADLKSLHKDQTNDLKSMHENQTAELKSLHQTQVADLTTLLKQQGAHLVVASRENPTLTGSPHNSASLEDVKTNESPPVARLPPVSRYPRPHHPADLVRLRNRQASPATSREDRAPDLGDQAVVPETTGARVRGGGAGLRHEERITMLGGGSGRRPLRGGFLAGLRHAQVDL
ncbi:hypothetical protein F4820DRAFT_444358 [Hypoxylon rubiginosum]|uniref:Uncharacterized protein n=1 Tax=Hypoxylon rubiginosum TaxID=110542 RepID=A0ACB9ZCF9_9PEZI|nr:hypothetical protein F4820DRAFT_444358 [Hypoxylon rubiginosum]